MSLTTQGKQKRVLMRQWQPLSKEQGEGFWVLHTHDVKATLASKGFDREPLKIIEICNPKYVTEVLNKI